MLTAAGELFVANLTTRVPPGRRVPVHSGVRGIGIGLSESESGQLGVDTPLMSAILSARKVAISPLANTAAFLLAAIAAAVELGAAEIVPGAAQVPGELGLGLVSPI